MRPFITLGRLVRDAWLILGLSLLLFCLVDAGARLVLLVHRQVGHPPLFDRRIRADTYSDSAFARAYYKEFDGRGSAIRWRSYVYWRRQPFHGKYINVDSAGLRITPAPTPPASGATRPLTVFMFGGSTMWGTGARDAFAIPALVAGELRHAGLNVEVTNFGETGYVSTQSLVALLLELRAGRRPDVVVFYDGVNDTFSAYSQLRAGLPHNEWHRDTEFNLSQGVRRLSRMLVKEAAGRLAILDLTKRARRRMGIASQPFPQPPRPDSLSRQVVTTYLSNLELLQSLSEHYHFVPLAYWQPTIFQKPRLTEYERLTRARVPEIEAFFQKTYARMESSAHGRMLHDLSQAFSDWRDPVYVDWMHLGETGNAVIARRIAGDILTTRATGARMGARSP